MTTVKQPMRLNMLNSFPNTEFILFLWLLLVKTATRKRLLWLQRKPDRCGREIFLDICSQVIPLLLDKIQMEDSAGHLRSMTASQADPYGWFFGASLAPRDLPTTFTHSGSFESPYPLFPSSSWTGVRGLATHHSPVYPLFGYPPKATHGLDDVQREIQVRRRSWSYLKITPTMVRFWHSRPTIVPKPLEKKTSLMTTCSGMPSPSGENNQPRDK